METYVKYPEPGPARPDQKNNLFNPPHKTGSGVCVIPPKAARKEGEFEGKNIKQDIEFER